MLLKPEIFDEKLLPVIPDIESGKPTQSMKNVKELGLSVSETVQSDGNNIVPMPPDKVPLQNYNETLISDPTEEVTNSVRHSDSQSVGNKRKIKSGARSLLSKKFRF